jgi:hypothetical protein
VGLGSTADDAIMEPIFALLRFEGLYSVTLYDTASISPGPGWILSNFLFAAFGLYWLLNPFYIIICLEFLKKQFQLSSEIGMLYILFLPCLLFWELLGTGHDLIAIGFCITLFLMICLSVIKKPNASPFLSSGLIVLVGIFSTARIVFVGFPVLLGLLIIKFHKAMALKMVVGGTGVCVFFHFIFWYFSDFYQPIHLFGRGQNQTGMPFMMIGFILTTGFVGLATFKVKDQFLSWAGYGLVCIMTPLFFVSMGELISSNQITSWEGVNYLFPFMPLLALIYSYRLGAALNKVVK